MTKEYALPTKVRRVDTTSFSVYHQLATKETEATSVIHYQFEAIHPFSDGNGRIGRLLISLLLLNWNLLPIPLLYLSAYFERQRRQYYYLMLSVSQTGAWSDWIAFFLNGITEQSKDAVIRAKRLQDLQLEWRDRLTQAQVNDVSYNRIFLAPQILEIIDG